MSELKFEHQITHEAVNLTLSRTVPGGLFRKAREEIVSTATWESIDSLNMVSSLARLESELEENTGEVQRLNDDGYKLTHHFVASLSDAQAQGLGLPATVPHTLSVSSTGPLLKPDGGQLRVTWKTSGARGVAAKIEGCFMLEGSKRFRLPLPTYKLLRSIDEFNKINSVESRLNALGKVTSELSELTGQTVVLDGQLADMNIAHATCLSIEPISVADGIDFEPVLFGKDIEVDNLEELVERSTALLTPIDQEHFNNSFRRSDKVNSTYVAGRTFVYLDPAIKTAAEVVREAQMASKEIRHRFVRSPQSFIKKRLIENGADPESVDELNSFGFVVTDQLSERVKELGVWTPPILPFKTPAAGDWKSIEYGIKIGDRHLIIPETELKATAEAIAHSIEAGTATVRILDDEEVPATRSVLSAVNQLVTEVSKLPPVLLPEADEADGRDDSIQPAKKLRNVLKVESNLDDEGFVVTFEPRCGFNGYNRPAGLLNEPKSHQIDGIKWLQESWCKGFPGVLLADDMGLGKTFQTLGFLSWLTEKRQSLGRLKQPILIVAPTSLLGTWQKEAEIHLQQGQLGRMAFLYGAKLRSFKTEKGAGNDVSEGKSCLDIRSLKDFEWVLTTYETMRDYHISLAALQFSCIVFDEMQKIKNISSLMTNAAQTLSGDFKLGLTGTPVENSLGDIWTLFDTLIPGGLGLGSLAEFGRYFMALDEEDENVKNARIQELSGRLLQPTSNTPPPMLRRMKLDVAKDLPPKLEKVLDAVMPTLQANSYHEALTYFREGSDRNTKIEGFMRMRSTSLHPVSAASRLAQEPDQFISESARLSQCIQLLDEIHSKSEKALVFVESIDMHEWLAPVLKLRYGMKHKPERIYGSVSASRRQDIVDRFQNPLQLGFDVLLLSPKAAGVGLTLTAATHVIHLTRWWNPAVEDQCTDRAYRIGQTKPVTVYYPRALHPVYDQSSFDVVIHKLLESKRALSRGVLAPNDERTAIDEVMSAL